MNDNKTIFLGFYKSLFTIAIPIILQNLLQTFTNMMDTVMVGQLGETAITSVGLGNQIFFLLNMALFGISSGGAIFISQFWGARNFLGIRKTLTCMMVPAFIVSVLFMAGGLFFPEKILGFYSDDIEVVKLGSSYLRIACLTYPLMAVSFPLQMSYRSTEHVILPMITTMISFVLNILANFILIFGFEPLSIPAFGAPGAAIGTVIARFVELCVTLSVGKLRKFEVFGTIKEHTAVTFEFIKKFFIVVIPVVLSESLWGCGISFQNWIFSHTGTGQYSAFNIMNTVNQLTWVFFIGIGNAAAIILGKKIGAGLEKTAVAFAHRFCWFFPLLGLGIGFILFSLSKLLPFIFKVDPSIISITQSLLMVLMCLYPFRAFNMLIIIGICRSGGDTIFSFIIDNGFMWFVALPLGYVAAFYWGASPWLILLCLEVEQLLKTAAGILRVISGKWLHNVTVERQH